ncbi:helix-turn-helix domain-containing protein [Streptomyces sp. NPDC048436]|uniref:helix-turn-helix domain-containing protein n=1 Tax=Streptomyces sp. NPDC048436 TaxID=3365550 RepID=UPI00371909CF
MDGERGQGPEQGRWTERQARVIPLRPRPHATRTAPHREAPARTGPASTAPLRTTPVPPAEKEPLWRDVVGDVLRRERLAQERTLKDVADAARISMPYLSELERGRKEASSEVLAAGARALGLSLADLLSLAQTELTRHAQPTRPRQGDIRLAA